jgi:hypothetical protein
MSEGDVFWHVRTRLWTRRKYTVAAWRSGNQSRGEMVTPERQHLCAKQLVGLWGQSRQHPNLNE